MQYQQGPPQQVVVKEKKKNQGCLAVWWVLPSSSSHLFGPLLVSYLYSFSIQLLTPNSYALHPIPNTAAIDNSHRIPHKMRAETYSFSFATSLLQLHITLPSLSLSLSSLRDQQANSHLKNNPVWRRSAAVSSPRKDANAALTAASAVWIAASPLPDFALLIHHATPISPNNINLQNKRWIRNWERCVWLLPSSVLATLGLW